MMRSKPELFEQYAAACREHAAVVRNPKLKSLFEDLAVQWGALASTTRDLRYSQDETSDFFKRGQSTAKPPTTR